MKQVLISMLLICSTHAFAEDSVLQCSHDERGSDGELYLVRLQEVPNGSGKYNLIKTAAVARETLQEEVLATNLICKIDKLTAYCGAEKADLLIFIEVINNPQRTWMFKGCPQCQSMVIVDYESNGVHVKKKFYPGFGGYSCSNSRENP